MNNKHFDQTKRIKFISFAFTIFVLLAASVYIFLASQSLITKELSPELEKKSIIVGETTLSPIKRALSYDLKLSELRGVPEHFQAVLKDNNEFRYISLTDDKGKMIHSVGEVSKTIQTFFKNIWRPANQKHSEKFDKFYDTRIPIEIDSSVVGYIHLGIDLNVIAQSTLEIVYDAIVVFLVSLLVTFEILIFIINYRVSRPAETVKKTLEDAASGFIHYLPFRPTKDEIGQFALYHGRLVKRILRFYQDVVNRFSIFEVLSEDKMKVDRMKSDIHNFNQEYKISQKKVVESSVGFIRTPLFIFVFGESLSISFLPIFSTYLYEPLWGLPKEFIVAMPIVFFMFIYTIAQPLSGIWSNISSQREIFLVGAFISCTGLLGAAFSEDLLTFLGWRMYTALGYGMVLIACQSYIIDNTPHNKRTQGFAVYISGFYSATVCGAAIGAILADNVGYKVTFMISAVMAGLSGMFVMFYIKDSYAEQSSKSFSFDAFKGIFKNSSFLSMLLCVSIPSKMMLASVIFYIAPMYLASIGTKQSEIGRIIMIYGFTMLVLSPIIARYADKLQKPKIFITVGAVLASLSFIPIVWHPGMWSFVATVLLLGVGHSINATAQIAIIPMLLKQESQQLGDSAISSIYRFLEMQGFVIGPSIAGFLISIYGYVKALTIISGISVSLTIVYILFLWLSKLGHKKEKPPQQDGFGGNESGQQGELTNH